MLLIPLLHKYFSVQQKVFGTLRPLLNSGFAKIPKNFSVLRTDFFEIANPPSVVCNSNEQTMIKVIQGDITKIAVDAVVNAANTSLLGGGGVDGAIHRVGGKEILEDCMKIRARQGGCDVGEAVITTAGNLPAKFVIHTVGPVWQGGNSKEDKLFMRIRTSK